MTEEQKVLLESQHRRERDGRVRDRIKAVLLRAEGWNQVHLNPIERVWKMIARAF